MTTDPLVPALIRTKLYRPPLPPDWVPRPRLLDRLQQQRQRPLTLVSAPAGFGKSTLLSAWLESNGVSLPPMPVLVSALLACDVISRCGRSRSWAASPRTCGGIPYLILVRANSRSDRLPDRTMHFQQGKFDHMILHKQQLITIHDAAIVTLPQGRKQPKTGQLHCMAGAGVLQEALWGMLFGK